MRTHILFTVAACLSICPAAIAHDTWISPSTYAARRGETISFDLTSGMRFPILDAAVKPERVAKAGFVLAAKAGELSGFKSGEKSLRFERAFDADGVAIVWLQLSPKDIELTDEDVAHYLEEARASGEVQRAWSAQKGKRKWKELYTKCAKTCVAIGDTEDDRSWTQPVGMPLEFVPLTNPTALRVGSEAKFKLLRNGRPLADAAVAVHEADGSGAEYATTDAEGAVTFRFGHHGPAMLATVHLRPPAQGKPWESEFSTLTFWVKEE